MSTTRTVVAAVSTGTGRQAFEDISVVTPDAGANRTQAVVGCLSETVGVASFTDGGAAVGTYQLVGSIPAGSLVLGTKIGPVVGFTGDTSAVLIVGDGSDADRYMTGTPNVFATDAVGIECGVPNGTKLVKTANRPTLTITSAADFTAVVTDAKGVVTVSIFYVQP